MNTEKIFNMYQADYLLKSNCKAIGCGIQGKIYIEFLRDKNFDIKMQEWKIRKH